MLLPSVLSMFIPRLCSVPEPVVVIWEPNMNDPPKLVWLDESPIVSVVPDIVVETETLVDTLVEVSDVLVVEVDVVVEVVVVDPCEYVIRMLCVAPHASALP
jgi:hypothetical protein